MPGATDSAGGSRPDYASAALNQIKTAAKVGYARSLLGRPMSLPNYYLKIYF